MGKKQITEAISPMLFHRKNFTLLCLLAGSSRFAFFQSWLPMMTRIRSMTSAPISQYIFCSSGMYQVPLSIRMAHTSAARASTHRMTAATRLPVALFLLAAVTTAGRLPVFPVEASTNSGADTRLRFRFPQRVSSNTRLIRLMAFWVSYRERQLW